MAAFDYSELSAVAVELIEEFGRAIIVRSFVKSGPDYAPTLIPSDVGAIGVKVRYKSMQIVENSDSLTPGQDFAFLTTSVITTSDRIVDGSTEYEIDAVDIVDPGDTVLLYKAKVRR